MIKHFIEQVNANPDIKSFVVFDNDKSQYVKNDPDLILHQSFVAIQLLAQKICREMTANRFEKVIFVGAGDKFLFRALDSEEAVFGVFCSGPRVDIDSLIDSQLKESRSVSSVPLVAPESSPPGRATANESMSRGPTAIKEEGSSVYQPGQPEVIWKDSEQAYRLVWSRNGNSSESSFEVWYGRGPRVGHRMQFKPIPDNNYQLYVTVSGQTDCLCKVPKPDGQNVLGFKVRASDKGQVSAFSSATTIS